ncbi:Josephin-domain-containing protein [Cylindrobasidium torrendii FP15055 ss-10]|uniref:ubiquitinyl hydrolase 1 n=1 Tax=Cylindrobasidium torrendii FP15055 ss-10 TaxID=1314674 RepID=A0A0D7AZP5_9AGAR|nr:Josephin-domain-containing protein [Cylindrobasidium torrendii FP15055 ss-10]
MASLAELVPYIYHEKQESGSMMCGQHALNSLLQGNYFTPTDLSSIAQHIDEQEQDVDDAMGGTSMDMDDSGFFSVQVIVRALEVWGLEIVGWRAEAMQPYLNIPHTQLAFIMNYQQHWYTLRRFGPAATNIYEDEGLGHWFNLDSLKPAPAWISKTYLGMEIQQAENDGYTVFAVVQKDSSQPLALARTEADRIAAAIPDNATVSGAELDEAGRRPAVHHHEFEGMEDEDIELQRVLQASITGSDILPPFFNPTGPTASGSSAPSTFGQGPPPATRQASVPLPSHRQPPVMPGGPIFGDEEEEQDEVADETDPVAASMARNQRLLERMRAEQQYAHRDLVDQGFAPRQQPEDDYDEQLRRAIAESEAMARSSTQETDEGTGGHTPPLAPPPAGHFGSRVYDDEDAEFQAALRASMETVPEGWTAPPELEQQTPRPPPQAPAQPNPAALVLPAQDDDADSVISEDTHSDIAAPAPEPSVDIDEMRRRRLARFGA